MPKGVEHLARYAEVARGANCCCLAALASLEDPSAIIEALRTVASPVRREGRSYRGFNPASEDDGRLSAAVLRGEHTLKSFRNGHLVERLCPATQDAAERRRQRARVTRLLQRLHTHRLIAKIPRSRRWLVTARGNAIISCMLKVHHQDYHEAFSSQAA